eukprot:CAMPEP_0119550206 /NCGR_PEP_ID=MMETSP1352-20130426/3763_1 /TAXON_ID=265584 /ORGANISM="Stauroneis constricta, Strain CCMP1120" /LENGTH=168 /DNA_ID=CAMNT_0007595977 /DNA_START=51 /DNA_END=557 /DNA_ORIENTATION=+
MTKATKEIKIASSLDLPNFVDLLLDIWLFQTDRKFHPKECHGARQVKEGMLIQTHVGDIIVQMKTLDKTGGYIEYHMVTDALSSKMMPNFAFNNMIGPAGLHSYCGKINITEDIEQSHQFNVHWEIEFQMKFWNAIVPSFGLGGYAFQSLQGDYLMNTLKLLKQTAEA